MHFNLKTYKYLKTKFYFKKMNFFFFFHGISLDNANWIITEQSLADHELNYFRVFNTLIINTFKNSIFKNLIILIHGPIILINNKNYEFSLRKLENVNPLINMLSLKLNNKIYSAKQVKNIKHLSYVKNIILFHNVINIFGRMPYYKLTKK